MLQRPILLRHLGDENLDTEVRIEAYTGLMSCPDAGLLEGLSDLVARTDAAQVTGYIASHLANLLAEERPASLEFRRLLQEEMVSSRPRGLAGLLAEPRRGRSRHFQYNLSRFRLEASLVWSDASYLPRRAGVRLTEVWLDRRSVLLEASLHSEGLEPLFERLFAASLNGDLLVFSRLLPRLMDAMPTIQAGLELRLAGHELASVHLDAADSAEPMLAVTQLLAALKAGLQDSNRRSSDASRDAHVWLTDSSLIWPTQIGLPIRLASQLTASSSAALRVGADAEQAAMTGRLDASVSALAGFSLALRQTASILGLGPGGLDDGEFGHGVQRELDVHLDWSVQLLLQAWRRFRVELASPEPVAAWQQPTHVGLGYRAGRIRMEAGLARLVATQPPAHSTCTFEATSRLVDMRVCSASSHPLDSLLEAVQASAHLRLLRNTPASRQIVEISGPLGATAEGDLRHRLVRVQLSRVVGCDDDGDDGDDSSAHLGPGSHLLLEARLSPDWRLAGLELVSPWSTGRVWMDLTALPRQAELLAVSNGYEWARGVFKFGTVLLPPHDGQTVSRGRETTANLNLQAVGRRLGLTAMRRDESAKKNDDGGRSEFRLSLTHGDEEQLLYQVGLEVKHLQPTSGLAWLAKDHKSLIHFQQTLSDIAKTSMTGTISTDYQLVAWQLALSHTWLMPAAGPSFRLLWRQKIETLPLTTLRSMRISGDLTLLTPRGWLAKATFSPVGNVDFNNLVELGHQHVTSSLRMQMRMYNRDNSDKTVYEDAIETRLYLGWEERETGQRRYEGKVNFTRPKGDSNYAGVMTVSRSVNVLMLEGDVFEANRRFASLSLNWAFLDLYSANYIFDWQVALPISVSLDCLKVYHFRRIAMQSAFRSIGVRHAEIVWKVTGDAVDLRELGEDAAPTLWRTAPWIEARGDFNKIDKFGRRGALNVLLERLPQTTESTGRSAGVDRFMIIPKLEASSWQRLKLTFNYDVLELMELSKREKANAKLKLAFVFFSPASQQLSHTAQLHIVASPKNHGFVHNQIDFDLEETEQMGYLTSRPESSMDSSLRRRTREKSNQVAFQLTASLNSPWLMEASQLKARVIRSSGMLELVGAWNRDGVLVYALSHRPRLGSLRQRGELKLVSAGEKVKWLVYSTQLDMLRLDSRVQLHLSSLGPIEASAMYDLGNGWTEKEVTGSISLSTPFPEYRIFHLGASGIGQLRYVKLDVDAKWGEARRNQRARLELVLEPKDRNHFNGMLKVVPVGLVVEIRNEYFSWEKMATQLGFSYGDRISLNCRLRLERIQETGYSQYCFEIASESNLLPPIEVSFAHNHKDPSGLKSRLLLSYDQEFAEFWYILGDTISSSTGRLAKGSIQVKLRSSYPPLREVYTKANLDRLDLIKDFGLSMRRCEASLLTTYNGNKLLQLNGAHNRTGLDDEFHSLVDLETLWTRKIILKDTTLSITPDSWNLKSGGTIRYGDHFVHYSVPVFQLDTSTENYSGKVEMEARIRDYQLRLQYSTHPDDGAESVSMEMGKSRHEHAMAFSLWRNWKTHLTKWELEAPLLGVKYAGNGSILYQNKADLFLVDLAYALRLPSLAYQMDGALFCRVDKVNVNITLETTSNMLIGSRSWNASVDFQLTGSELTELSHRSQVSVAVSHLFTVQWTNLLHRPTHPFGQAKSFFSLDLRPVLPQWYHTQELLLDKRNKTYHYTVMSQRLGVHFLLHSDPMLKTVSLMRLRPELYHLLLLERRHSTDYSSLDAILVNPLSRSAKQLKFSHRLYHLEGAQFAVNISALLLSRVAMDTSGSGVIMRLDWRDFRKLLDVELMLEGVVGSLGRLLAEVELSNGRNSGFVKTTYKDIHSMNMSIAVNRTAALNATLEVQLYRNYPQHFAMWHHLANDAKRFVVKSGMQQLQTRWYEVELSSLREEEDAVKVNYLLALENLKLQGRYVVADDILLETHFNFTDRIQLRQELALTKCESRFRWFTRLGRPTDSGFVEVVRKTEGDAQPNKGFIVSLATCWRASVGFKELTTDAQSSPRHEDIVEFLEAHCKHTSYGLVESTTWQTRPDKLRFVLGALVGLPRVTLTTSSTEARKSINATVGNSQASASLVNNRDAFDVHMTASSPVLLGREEVTASIGFRKSGVHLNVVLPYLTDPRGLTLGYHSSWADEEIELWLSLPEVPLLGPNRPPRLACGLHFVHKHHDILVMATGIRAYRAYGQNESHNCPSGLYAGTRSYGHQGDWRQGVVPSVRQVWAWSIHTEVRLKADEKSAEGLVAVEMGQTYKTGYLALWQWLGESIHDEMAFALTDLEDWGCGRVVSGFANLRAVLTRTTEQVVSGNWLTEHGYLLIGRSRSTKPDLPKMLQIGWLGWLLLRDQEAEMFFNGRLTHRLQVGLKMEPGNGENFTLFLLAQDLTTRESEKPELGAVLDFTTTSHGLSSLGFNVTKAGLEYLRLNGAWQSSLQSPQSLPFQLASFELSAPKLDPHFIVDYKWTQSGEIRVKFNSQLPNWMPVRRRLVRLMAKARLAGLEQTFTSGKLVLDSPWTAVKRTELQVEKPDDRGRQAWRITFTEDDALEAKYAHSGWLVHKRQHAAFAVFDNSPAKHIFLLNTWNWTEDVSFAGQPFGLNGTLEVANIFSSAWRLMLSPNEDGRFIVNVATGQSQNLQPQSVPFSLLYAWSSEGVKEFEVRLQDLMRPGLEPINTSQKSNVRQELNRPDGVRTSRQLIGLYKNVAGTRLAQVVYAGGHESEVGPFRMVTMPSTHVNLTLVWGSESAKAMVQFTPPKWSAIRQPVEVYLALHGLEVNNCRMELFYRKLYPQQPLRTEPLRGGSFEFRNRPNLQVYRLAIDEPVILARKLEVGIDSQKKLATFTQLKSFTDEVIRELYIRLIDKDSGNNSSICPLAAKFCLQVNWKNAPDNEVILRFNSLPDSQFETELSLNRRKEEDLLLGGIERVSFAWRDEVKLLHVKTIDEVLFHVQLKSDLLTNSGHLLTAELRGDTKRNFVVEFARNQRLRLEYKSRVKQTDRTISTWSLLMRRKGPEVSLDFLVNASQMLQLQGNLVTQLSGPLPLFLLRLECTEHDGVEYAVAFKSLGSFGHFDEFWTYFTRKDVTSKLDNFYWLSGTRKPHKTVMFSIGWSTQVGQKAVQIRVLNPKPRKLLLSIVELTSRLELSSPIDTINQLSETPDNPAAWTTRQLLTYTHTLTDENRLEDSANFRLESELFINAAKVYTVDLATWKNTSNFDLFMLQLDTNLLGKQCRLEANVNWMTQLRAHVHARLAPNCFGLPNPPRLTFDTQLNLPTRLAWLRKSLGMESISPAARSPRRTRQLIAIRELDSTLPSHFNLRPDTLYNHTVPGEPTIWSLDDKLPLFRRSNLYLPLYDRQLKLSFAEHEISLSLAPRREDADLEIAVVMVKKVESGVFLQLRDPFFGSSILFNYSLADAEHHHVNWHLKPGSLASLLALQTIGGSHAHLSHPTGFTHESHLFYGQLWRPQLHVHFNALNGSTASLSFFTPTLSSVRLSWNPADDQAAGLLWLEMKKPNSTLSQQVILAQIDRTAEERETIQGHLQLHGWRLVLPLTRLPRIELSRASSTVLAITLDRPNLWRLQGLFVKTSTSLTLVSDVESANLLGFRTSVDLTTPQKHIGLVVFVPAQPRRLPWKVTLQTVPFLPSNPLALIGNLSVEAVSSQLGGLSLLVTRDLIGRKRGFFKVSSQPSSWQVTTNWPKKETTFLLTRTPAMSKALLLLGDVEAKWQLNRQSGTLEASLERNDLAWSLKYQQEQKAVSRRLRLQLSQLSLDCNYFDSEMGGRTNLQVDYRGDNNRVFYLALDGPPWQLNRLDRIIYTHGTVGFKLARKLGHLTADLRVEAKVHFTTDRHTDSATHRLTIEDPNWTVYLRSLSVHSNKTIHLLKVDSPIAPLDGLQMSLAEEMSSESRRFQVTSARLGTWALRLASLSRVSANRVELRANQRRADVSWDSVEGSLDLIYLPRLDSPTAWGLRLIQNDQRVLVKMENPVCDFVKLEHNYSLDGLRVHGDLFGWSQYEVWNDNNTIGVKMSLSTGRLGTFAKYPLVALSLRSLSATTFKGALSIGDVFASNWHTSLEQAGKTTWNVDFDILAVTYRATLLKVHSAGRKETWLSARLLPGGLADTGTTMPEADALLEFTCTTRPDLLNCSLSVEPTSQAVRVDVVWTAEPRVDIRLLSHNYTLLELIAGWTSVTAERVGMGNLHMTASVVTMSQRPIQTDVNLVNARSRSDRVDRLLFACGLADRQHWRCHMSMRQAMATGEEDSQDEVVLTLFNASIRLEPAPQAGLARQRLILHYWRDPLSLGYLQRRLVKTISTTLGHLAPFRRALSPIQPVASHLAASVFNASHALTHLDWCRLTGQRNACLSSWRHHSVAKWATRLPEALRDDVMRRLDRLEFFFSSTEHALLVWPKVKVQRLCVGMFERLENLIDDGIHATAWLGRETNRVKRRFLAKLIHGTTGLVDGLDKLEKRVEKEWLSPAAEAERAKAMTSQLWSALSLVARQETDGGLNQLRFRLPGIPVVSVTMSNRRVANIAETSSRLTGQLGARVH
ncbi:unnamed protein product, partial [Protopolystoma xenopodis]